MFSYQTQNKIVYLDLKINTISIDRVSEFSFLWLIISSDLKWGKHIDHIGLKISKVIGIMYRLRPTLPEDILLTIYNSLIVPHFNYCHLVWSCNIHEGHKLHLLQKKALRIITNSHFIAHSEPLCKRLRVVKVIDMFEMILWKFYYNHNISLTEIEKYHLQFIKRTLGVKMTTNSSVVYAETGIFPLHIYINVCMIKYWFKILNGDTNKLIHIAYMEMFQHPERSAWIKHIKDLLCCHCFEYIWKDQAVNNEKAFISLFECRIKDEFIQKCFSDIRNSDRCRLYKEIKTVFCCESYMNCEIKQNLRVNYTKLRLSSHKFLVESARWRKVKIPYAQRTCTLCSSGDIEDEYHIVLICENFRDVRLKYIKPYYHNRPSMFKFVELMNTTNKRDRFRLMLFLKIVFNLYGETL